MKTKLLYLAAVLGVLLLSFVFRTLDREQTPIRYHQHRQQPSQAELGDCETCGGEGKLCTHLPLIVIETGGQKIPGAAIYAENGERIGEERGKNGEERILADLYTIEASGVMHHPDDVPDITAQAFIRCRGNTSRGFDKHGYQIRLVKNGDPEQNDAQPLLGMNAHHEWALHGPFLDKTLLRNYMWMNISAQVMGYAPNVRFCEVVLNGEYQGVYLLMETISVSEARVNMTEYEDGDLISSYLLRLGTSLNPLKTVENFTYYTERLEKYVELEVLYPTLSHQNERILDYICADFSEIERLLFSTDMIDGSGSWRELIDEDSFVNYYILQEFLAVNDAFSESTYFYKDVRGKLHIGPVWDYNNSLDNFLRPVALDEFLLPQRGWYAGLMQDEEFVERVIARYRQLREGVLSEEYLESYIDETVAWLGEAVERNFSVWGYSFDISQLDRYQYRQPSLQDKQAIRETFPLTSVQILEGMAEQLNPSSYEEAVEQMRDAIELRGDWMDEHIDSLRQYCAESKKAARIIY